MKPKTYIKGLVILLALVFMTLAVVFVLIPFVNNTSDNNESCSLVLQSTTAKQPLAELAPPLNISETLADEIYLSLEWSEAGLCIYLHNSSDFHLTFEDSPVVTFDFFDGSDWRIVPGIRENWPISPMWGIGIGLPPRTSSIIININPYIHELHYRTVNWRPFFPLPHDRLHRVRVAISVIEIPEGWYPSQPYECPEFG